MSFLLQFYPGDLVIRMIAMLAILVAFVVFAAFAFSRFPTRRRGVTRSAIWLATLVSVLSAPLLAVGLEVSGITLIRLPKRQPSTVEPMEKAEVPDRATESPEFEDPDVPTIVPREVVAESNEVPLFVEMPEVAHAHTPAVTSRSPYYANEWRTAAAGMLLLWLAGVGVCAIRFLYGCRALACLRRDVRAVEDKAVTAILADVCRTLGIEIPRLVTSGRVNGPIVTGGPGGAMVILPRTLAGELNHRQLRDVFTHECAHLAQRDIFVGVLQRIAKMIYWPHPLVHILNRELRAAREDICDNYVLQRGDAAGYARTLVQLSTAVDFKNTPVATCGMLSSAGQLETRVAALLNERRDLITRTKRSSLALFGLGFLALSALTFGTRPATGENADAQPVVAEIQNEKSERGEPVIQAEDVTRSEVEKKAIAAITQLGGKIEYDNKQPGKPVVGVVLNKVTDAGLVHLSGLTSLKTLDLSRAPISNAGLVLLRGLTNLETLILRGRRHSKMSDAGLVHLKGMTKLRKLDLTYVKITGPGLVHLKGMTKLRTLDLSWTLLNDDALVHLKGFTNLRVLDLNGYSSGNITDAGLVHLKGLTRLERLLLHRNQIGDAGLVHLNGMTNLRELLLSRTRITDAGLAHLKGLTKLQYLWVHTTRITDAGLATLGRLAGLRTLSVANNPVTDAGVEKLQGLTKLQRLDLSGTKVTAAGLKQLAEFPNLHHLSLFSAPVTDAWLAHLGELPNLQTLYFPHRNKISDAGLVHLKKAAKLNYLFLGVCDATDAGVKKLKAALPKCTIIKNEFKIERSPLMSLSQSVRLAKVIAVARGLSFALAPPSVPGDAPEYLIKWRVIRFMKGKLTKKIIHTRLPSDPKSITKNYIGQSKVVMLSPAYVAGKYKYAGLYHIDYEARVKAILAKDPK